MTGSVRGEISVGDAETPAWAEDLGGRKSVERRLMPEGMEWPRFEDGEPVRFGDVVSDGYETGRVYYVTFDTVNPVIIGFTDERPDQDPGTWLEVSVSDGERVNRPAPKVLDADGVEIREGDTVCGTRDMEPMKVVDTDSHEFGFKRVKCEKKGDGFWFYCPDELTHRAPVLAADGVPLEVGQTVYGVGGGEEFEVVNIRDGMPLLKCRGGEAKYTATEPEYLTHARPVLAADGRPLREGETVYEVEGTGHAYKVVGIRVGDGDPLTPTVVTCDEGDGTSEHFLPPQLTHERPDSWERLEEDAEKDPCGYFGFDGEEPCGKCPASGKNCEQTMAIDLVRRCRALAERERGE